MNRIENAITKSKKSLIGYFMCGEFSQEKTLEIMHKGVESGIDCLEIGFPFSDPTADGATIQESAKISLKNDKKIDNAFELIKNFRKDNNKTPVILMGYFNIIFQYGLENFAKACHDANIDGLIVVDLPIEESLEFENILDRYNIYLIQIVSFLTDRDRFLQIERRAKGFIYLISTFGITGGKQPMIEKIQNYTKKMQSRLPIAIGFGISDAQTSKEISQYCNAIIIGSYFIKLAREENITKLLESIKEIKESLI